MCIPPHLYPQKVPDPKWGYKRDMTVDSKILFNSSDVECSTTKEL